MQPTILFFDSGLGGLSVYKEVKALLPDCHYLYCLDNAGFPYSEKPEEVIIDRTLKICQKINRTFPLDLIVIACNTASTVVLPSLREHLAIPIVGTVPAIKPAAKISESKHIGLLATKGTIKRTYVNNLIKDYASDCNVEKLGSTVLVEIAEKKLRNGEVDLLQLGSELEQWKGIDDLDTVVLGCTHFPLIKDEIKQFLPQVNYFIDSGKAIALRVQNLLKNVNIKEKQNQNIENLVFYTKNSQHEAQFENALYQLGFKTMSVINVI
ncbi:glutamate racemase [Bisgaardia hudsonensis]|uniref:Glutamate racemase n=1 Tax=Bisgaardia hudsonensis TaxID=109472 RepID=A0A4R2MZS0_9PAST|nr:glutamate racemase [Bisgaardia hudsonensis]QLB13552.1 glutamate racemase [Bisgaardia hudsonensis]TCP10876.1 glutamate racemase [Bisgaardia hudsonensis]